MKTVRILMSFIFLLLPLAVAAQKSYNIKDNGATGDGKTMDSPAIQKAIDACSGEGGGTVYIPAGTYLSATIVLKDNVKLYLEKGALLLGTTDIKAYKNLDPFTEGLGVDVGWAFLIAIDAKNIAIEGEGIIDGQGAALKAAQIAGDNRPESERWGQRPFLLRVLRCDGVTVRNVTLKYAGAWTSHYAQSRNIQIEGVKIESYGIAHNDGINIDGCQHVRIKDCNIVSGDDALCFKTTHSKFPCSDIVVSGMQLKSNQAAIKMGTESMAPFEDIHISNCKIYDTKNGGIKLFSVDGARLKNIDINDITMDNIQTPMMFRLGSRLSVFRKNQDTQQTTGSFENVVIRNVKAKSAKETQLTPASGILITGVPGHYITGLTLENIEIELPGGGTVEEGRHVVQEAVDQYPEVKTFAPYLPAYGIWARHVKRLNLNNVTFKLVNPDLRPALVCEDGQHILVNNFKTDVFKGSEAIMRLEGVNTAYISAVNATGESNALLQSSGKGNSEIYLDGAQTATVAKMTDFVNGANEKDVMQRPYFDAANSAVPGAHLSYTPGVKPAFWSIAAAQTAMTRWPDFTKAYFNAWTYVNGYMFCAFERLYKDTKDETYMAYIKRYIDSIIDKDGNFMPVCNFKGLTQVPNYCTNLDGMMTGNTVVMLYEHYKDNRYKIAAQQIRKCFNGYPRNSDGGFWHSNTMHGQMWIDGIFMGQMFLLRFGKSIGDSEYAFNEAITQITAYSKTGLRGNTGLYVHGVFEAGHGDRVCRWADPKGGQSSEVWGEGLGWYALVLVEALETIPSSHPRYHELVDIYKRLAAGLKKVQDPKTGGWYQVTDKPQLSDNWLETSGSAMFTYTIQQGINLGLISKKEYGKVAANGYKFITSNAKINKNGLVDIYEACDGVGVQENYDKYIHYKKSLNAKEAYVGFVWATEIMERNAIQKKK